MVSVEILHLILNTIILIKIPTTHFDIKCMLAFYFIVTPQIHVLFSRLMNGFYYESVYSLPEKNL